MWVGCVRSYQQSLQHYVLGSAAKRGDECDRGGEGTQGKIIKSTYPFLISVKKKRNPFPFNFLRLDKKKLGLKIIHLSLFLGNSSEPEE